MMENKSLQNKLHVVMYHYTRDLAHSRYAKIKGLDISLFREQIIYLKQMFHIVTMEEVIDAKKGLYDLPENALLLTFDDGYIDNYIYALPILEEEKVQGSFFIPGKTFAEHQLLDVNKIHYILACANQTNLLTDIFEKMNYYRGKEFNFPDNEDLYAQYGARKGRFDSREVLFVKAMLQTVLPENVRNQISSDLLKKYVGASEEQLAYELYMTRDQIRLMKRHGMYIGIHGYDHYWLANLSEQKMKTDIDRALDVMGEFIDRQAWVINYPYGNYDERVIAHIKRQGCCLGFTTEVRVADLNRDNRYKLPRLDCNDFPPKSENYKKIQTCKFQEG